MKPVGALSREEAIAVAKRKGVIYKVYLGVGGRLKAGEIRQCVATSATGSGINTVPFDRRISYSDWFKPFKWKPYGFLFDNYFHALAYSLQLKRGDDETRNVG